MPKYLTPRQKDVLDLTLEGKSPQEVAKTLHLSLHTVRGYLGELRAKYQVRSVSELIVKVLSERQCDCGQKGENPAI